MIMGARNTDIMCNDMNTNRQQSKDGCRHPKMTAEKQKSHKKSLFL